MSDRRSPERIAYVLQALAADLAAERRRVLVLRRENRALKAKLAVVQYDLDRIRAGDRIRSGDPDEAERPPPTNDRSFPIAS